jgi:hypothetical protein
MVLTGVRRVYAKSLQIERQNLQCEEQARIGTKAIQLAMRS